MRRSLIVEDILLIEPAYKNKYPPIGLMKIAYFHRYIMHDYVRFAKGRLPEGLENKKWDRVYVTTLFTFEWENTKKALQYALSVVKPGGKVFTGGILATLRPEWIAKEFPTVINNTGLLNHEGTLGLKGEECIDTLPLDYGILDDIKDEYKYPAEDAYFTYMTSRGFRGIGRLSGLGYCQKLKFLTSIHGEEKASCIIYDAEKLKYLLSPQVDSRDSIDQVLSSVLTIEEIPERINKHYFSVELYGVVPESDLLNDSEVVPYLQQNLPVPFSRDFVWGSMIKQKLVQMEVELAEYNVELRTDRTVIDICKPYKNKILADRIRKINDSISDINFVPFYSGEKVTAMLWYAETNFLGTVLDKDIKGIRIRQGNILIGDENTLRKCYKEERFNSWMVGELLVFNEDIIPNTRRDDYEKNSAYKELLSQFTEWANEMSRQIRHRSYERSLTQSDKKFLADESVTDVDGVDISLGTELDSYDMDDSDSVANTDLLSKLSLLMDMGKKKTKYNVLNLNSKFTVDQKQTLEHVFDALYAKYTNAKANDIIQTIIDSF